MIELTVEQRLKRIEDQLGLTELDERKRKRDSLVSLYRAYGFSNVLAKSYGNASLKDGRTVEEVETSLIKRGAIKWEH